MNSGTAENRVRIVLDTNISISAIGFGGIPREVFLLTIEEKIKGVISQILLVELVEVINKKFPKLIPNLSNIERYINESLQVTAHWGSLRTISEAIFHGGRLPRHSKTRSSQ